jgi:predicted flap endonuclease-1-like 5' DNA nuclease
MCRSRSKDQRSGLWCWMSLTGAMILALWWWLRRHPGRRETLKTKLGASSTVEVPEVKPTPSAVEPPEAEVPPSDDLRRIDGIGPKISDLLQSAGITTFGELADADVADLRTILQEAGIRIADPTTWPEQAELAAAGEWDALKALQSQLKGGRRT